MKTELLYILQKAFFKRATLSKKELVDVLKTLYPPTVNRNTISWQIHDLKQKGILSHQARGLYALGTAKKQHYSPGISPFSIELYTDIREELPYTALVLTDTAWFNEFMLHQAFKTYPVLEVEKEAVGTVFGLLTARNKKAFLNPGKEIMENYVPNTEEAIIIKSLISESPINLQAAFEVASLEKMLVDIICDVEIYSAQNAEAEGIFAAALDKYTLNSAKIRRYARRRNREAAITRLLDQNTAT